MTALPAAFRQRSVPAALLALALAVSLPFLQPHHRNPIPSFFGEWWAALFGLLALLPVVADRRISFILPRCAWIPAALAGLLLLQLALQRPVQPGSVVLGLLYLLWAAALMGLAHTLVRDIGLPRLCLWLAWGLLLGSLASATIAYLQLLGIPEIPGLVSGKLHERLYGNLNQPNHFADQLWLGIAALLYLRTRRRATIPFAFSCLVLLTSASQLSASRAVWAYAAGLLVLTLWAERRWQTLRDARLVFWATLAVGLTITAKVLLAALPLVDATVAARLLQDSASDGQRLGLWRIALEIGSQHPWLGAGWGRYPAAGYAVIPGLRAALPAGSALTPAEHAHNIFLQLFAELGLAAPLLVLAGGLAWWWRGLRHGWQLEHWLLAALLLVLGAHSQLEYPLWYTLFLGVAALALGAGDPRSLPLRINVTGSRVAPLLTIAAMALLLLLRTDYQRLEKVLSWPRVAEGEVPVSWPEAYRELADLRRRSPFTAQADFTLAWTLPIDDQGLHNKLRVVDLGMRSFPAVETAHKQAALLALAGQDAAARNAMRQALAVYPEQIAKLRERTMAIAKTYPAAKVLLDVFPAEAT